MSHSRYEKNKFYRPTEVTVKQTKKLQLNEKIALAMKNFTESQGFNETMREVIADVLPIIFTLNNPDQKIGKARREKLLTNINCRLNQLRDMGCIVESENGDYSIVAPGHEERLSLLLTERAKQKENLEKVIDAVKEMGDGLKLLENTFKQISNFGQFFQPSNDEKKDEEKETNNLSKDVEFGKK